MIWSATQKPTFTLPSRPNSSQSAQFPLFDGGGNTAKYALQIYDDAEHPFLGSTPPTCTVSPCPPPAPIPGLSLPYEVNVVSLDGRVYI